MSSSLSSSDVAVSVRGLSKSYTIAHNAENHTTAGEALMHRLKNPLSKPETETFWALKDVEFDIQKGDVVGIIGRNGAGKSTLLKVLSRITEPTTGQIDLYGRVGSLLEVGTGFHPELTGRENVYLNGAILGMKKSEITRQFDAIVDFSGTEQFLDTPVKRYSSGMYVRLAFAVAAHLNPEILIIDEVLAVGDAEFQKKCIGKMQDVAAGGRTVIFVSHHMQSITALCGKIILLKSGHVDYSGEVTGGVQKYMAAPKEKTSSKDDAQRREGSGELRFVSVRSAKENYNCGEEKTIEFSIERFKQHSGRYYVSCHIVNDQETIVLHLDSRLVRPLFDASISNQGYMTIKQPWLKPGNYRVDMFICSEGIVDKYEGACQICVDPVFPYTQVTEPLAGTYGAVFADFTCS